LIQDTLSLGDGPLGPQVPGGVTRWMAVPWQTDTASCRSGYLKTYDPYLPTFWPARVPNQVLTNANYEIVMDEQRPLGERLAAFANRAAWIRPLGTKSYTDQINNMISHFGDLGLVETREGIKDSQDFPPVMEIENLPPPRLRGGLADVVDQSVIRSVITAAQLSQDIDLTNIEKVHRFPHGLRR